MINTAAKRQIREMIVAAHTHQVFPWFEGHTLPLAIVPLSCIGGLETTSTTPNGWTSR